MSCACAESCEPNEPAPHPGVMEFTVRGLNCQNCVRKATEALQKVPGVTGVVVTLETARATVQFQPAAPVSSAVIVSALGAAGYPAEPVSSTRRAAPASAWSPLAGWQFNVVFGGVITALLMLGEWGFALGGEGWFQWTAFALSLPVQVVCGARFYVGAWRQLRAGRSNMDTLVALGSTTAFGFSTWALLSGWPGHAYFMEAAAIITLISVGHWMEARMSARAANSLRALLTLAPATARRLTPAGAEQEIPVTQLQPGDHVVLRPGDRVPVDGEVHEGQSAVDEAMLTGESLPVEKATGAKLYAGTVNQNGRLVFRVTATGTATALAQIIALVQRAQSSRAAIQKLGDQVSAVFVPVVVLVAVATGLWWGLAYESALRTTTTLLPFLPAGHFPATPLAAAFIHAAGVLIVACPCAMGLATPAAIMAGVNAAARRGILIRDGAALEKSGRITAVLLDKTGTLTEGKLAVAAMLELKPSPEPLAELAAQLTTPSNHPLSRALAAQATPAHAAAFTDWREVRGAGIEATTAAGGWRLGSLPWLAASGVAAAPADFVAEWSGRGATVLGLARGTELLGLFALRDQLKPAAARMVARLGAQGKAVYLVTGDMAGTAAAIAEQAGIPKANVFAGVRPEGKTGIVQQLQARGERVAFVGDGINDAPALEQADLGIAVARASDVAREAADILLLQSDLLAVPAALALAQATLRTIKQNLFWAFFYNAAAVPLAALGLLSPVLCAAAMGLSDVIVIGNALRLRAHATNPESTRD